MRLLLSHSLDYAGMFPPTGLALEPAVSNYARYLAGPDSWFLARFVCPADRLAELGSCARLLPGSPELTVSALGVPRKSVPCVRIEAIEAPLPPELLRSAEVAAIQDVIRAVAESIEQMTPIEVTPFFEAPGKEAWREITAASIDAIAEHNAVWRAERCRPAAFKLRTGGVTADACPSIEQVAFVITRCQERGVAFKCTAGLHHPVRRQDESVGTKMHGFLNVFGAAILAHARKASLGDVRDVLADQDPASFRFEEDGFSWQGTRASLEEIAAARRDLIVSFGSCSFEEPLEDLRALRLL